MCLRHRHFWRGEGNPQKLLVFTRSKRVEAVGASSGAVFSTVTEMSLRAQRCTIEDVQAIIESPMQGADASLAKKRESPGIITPEEFREYARALPGPKRLKLATPEPTERVSTPVPTELVFETRLPLKPLTPIMEHSEAEESCDDETSPVRSVGVGNATPKSRRTPKTPRTGPTTPVVAFEAAADDRDVRFPSSRRKSLGAKSPAAPNTPHTPRSGARSTLAFEDCEDVLMPSLQFSGRKSLGRRSLSRLPFEERLGDAVDDASCPAAIASAAVVAYVPMQLDVVSGNDEPVDSYADAGVQTASPVVSSVRKSRLSSRSAAELAELRVRVEDLAGQLEEVAAAKSAAESQLAAAQLERLDQELEAAYIAAEKAAAAMRALAARADARQAKIQAIIADAELFVAKHQSVPASARELVGSKSPATRDAAVASPLRQDMSGVLAQEFEACIEEADELVDEGVFEQKEADGDNIASEELVVKSPAASPLRTVYTGMKPLQGLAMTFVSEPRKRGQGKKGKNNTASMTRPQKTGEAAPVTLPHVAETDDAPAPAKDVPLQQETTTDEPSPIPKQTRKETTEQKQNKSKQRQAAEKPTQPKPTSSKSKAKQAMDSSKRVAALTAVKEFVAEHYQNDCGDNDDAHKYVADCSPMHASHDESAAANPTAKQRTAKTGKKPSRVAETAPLAIAAEQHVQAARDTKPEKPKKQQSKPRSKDSAKRIDTEPLEMELPEPAEAVEEVLLAERVAIDRFIAEPISPIQPNRHVEDRTEQALLRQPATKTKKSRKALAATPAERDTDSDDREVAAPKDKKRTRADQKETMTAVAVAAAAAVQHDTPTKPCKKRSRAKPDKENADVSKQMPEPALVEAATTKRPQLSQARTTLGVFDENRVASALEELEGSSTSVSMNGKTAGGTSRPITLRTGPLTLGGKLKVPKLKIAAPVRR